MASLDIGVNETTKNFNYNIEEELIDPYKALGRVTSANILSESDNPPFNMSAMDGYAVCNKPKDNIYKVAHEVFAGDKINRKTSLFNS